MWLRYSEVHYFYPNEISQRFKDPSEVGDVQNKLSLGTNKRSTGKPSVNQPRTDQLSPDQPSRD